MADTISREQFLDGLDACNTRWVPIVTRLIDRMESEHYGSVFESNSGGSTRDPSERYRIAIEGQGFKDTKVCVSTERSGFVWVIGRDLIKGHNKLASPFAGEDGNDNRRELAARLNSVHSQMSDMSGLIGGGSPKFGIGLLGNDDAFQRFCAVIDWMKDVYTRSSPSAGLEELFQ